MSDEKFILDATAGFRMMWFNKQQPNTIYLDIRPECEPDIVGDFRDLKQFKDETFRLIIFDPPHIIRKSLGQIGMIHDYGQLEPETWQMDLDKGLRECWRVLKPFGIMLFKWSSQQIPSNEILKLGPAHPLIYQVTSNKRREKSHSNYQTLWFVFMKIPSDVNAFLNEITKNLMRKCNKADCIHWEDEDCEYGLAYRLKNCAIYKAFMKIPKTNTEG